MNYKKDLLSIYPIIDNKINKDKYYFGITATYPRLENYNSNENDENKINNLQNFNINDSSSVFFQKYFKKLGFKNLTNRPIQCKNINMNKIDNSNVSNFNLDKSILIFTGHSRKESDKIYGNYNGKYNPSEILLKYFRNYINIPNNILFYNCYGARNMCLNLDHNIVKNRNIYCINERVSRKRGVNQTHFFNKEYSFFKIVFDLENNDGVYSDYIGLMKLGYFFKKYLII